MTDFAIGDATGLRIPAHRAALIAAGPAFLTEAFRRFGAIAPDNAVRAIAACDPCPGGSTGDKCFLTLDYLRDEPGLQRTLFCKFSRDFADARRDWQKTEMAGEARLVALSRQPGFPIRVPAGYFADFESASGTGLVVTERIPFGEHGIEPHRRKCLDHATMADPLPYYRAIVTALARLAAAHKSGGLSDTIAAQFPWDAGTGSADPIRLSAERLDAELDRCAAFARDCPRLLPPALRDPSFLEKMRADAHLIAAHEAEIRAALVADPALIALNHWNAHIDNAWFWREHGALHCGLIDWGRVGQITMGAALWGALSAAHHAIWTDHLDSLLALFVAEYRAGGGPEVAVPALRRHLTLHMALMAVARVLVFPEVIRFRLPQCPQAAGPYDAMFEPVAADPARNCLSIYTAMLLHWHAADFGAAVRALL